MEMGKIEQLILLVISFLIKALSKKRLLILNYHSISEISHELSSGVDKKKFEWQMHLISRYLSPVKLSDGFKQLNQKGLTAGAVAVTFDDGYKDNVTLALPILKKYDLELFPVNDDPEILDCRARP